MFQTGRATRSRILAKAYNGVVGGGVAGMITKEDARRFAKDLIKSLTLYCLIVAGGTVLVLVTVSAAGYLPYSDRPGPGWHAAHIPRLHEIGFYLSFAVFFAITFCLLWGAALFIFARCLGWLSAPRLLVALVGGIAAGWVTLIGAAGTGWYIAIAAFPVYAAGVLGLLFGALVLPRFANLHGGSRNWKHWLGIAITSTVFLGLIAYPILPHRNSQSLQVTVIRLLPGSEAIGSDGKTLGLSEEQLVFLKSLGLGGSLSFVMQSDSGLSETTMKAKAAVLFTQPIKSRAELRQPKGGNVLYVQMGDKWILHPKNAPTIGRKIAFWPSGDGTKIQFQIDSGGGGIFSWYPLATSP
jgi:MFS family permease